MKAALKAGQIEYTILTQCVVPRIELQEVGFYYDDLNQGISQKETTWEELI
jgi:hypothetical protein